VLGSNQKEYFRSVARVGGNYVAVGSVARWSGTPDYYLSGERERGLLEQAPLSGVIARFDGGSGEMLGVDVLGSAHRLTSVVATSDGGYAIAGTVGGEGDFAPGLGIQLGTHATSGFYQGVLRKHSASGALEWQAYLGGGSVDVVATSVAEVDGGYLVAGKASVRSSEGAVVLGKAIRGYILGRGSSALLVKINVSGGVPSLGPVAMVEGNRTSSNLVTGTSVVEASDAYVMTGVTTSGTLGDGANWRSNSASTAKDAYVARFSKDSLDLISAKLLGCAYADGNINIEYTDKSGMPYSATSDPSLVRLDADGGVAVVVSDKQADGSGNRDLFVARLKSAALQQPIVLYGGAGSELAYGAIGSNGSVVIAIQTDSSNSSIFEGILSNGKSDAALIKITGSSLQIFGSGVN
jgi:hypothetical protein